MKWPAIDEVVRQLFDELGREGFKGFRVFTVREVVAFQCASDDRLVALSLNVRNIIAPEPKLGMKLKHERSDDRIRACGLPACGNDRPRPLRRNSPGCDIHGGEEVIVVNEREGDLVLVNPPLWRESCRT